MRKIIIAAIARNNVMGRESGEMPWHSKEEYQHFRNTTLGHPVIMGRKTFKSLEKPLKGRLNIILTKSHVSEMKKETEEMNVSMKPDEVTDGIKVFERMDEAYEYCTKIGAKTVFVIGGGKIFEQFINEVDEMILSYMDFEAKGDVMFPQIDKNIWMAKSREKRSEFEIVHYVKRNGDASA